MTHDWVSLGRQLSAAQREVGPIVKDGIYKTDALQHLTFTLLPELYASLSAERGDDAEG